MGKKKNHDNKANSKGLPPKDEKEDRNVVEGEMDVSLEIGFAGKKKSKGKKVGATKNVSFELLDDDQGNGKEDEDASISFSGKKNSKSGKRNPESVGSASVFSVLEEDGDDPIDEMEEDDSVVKFSGKKKSSKKKNDPKIDEDEPKMSSVEKDDVPMESCKSKKRKKKGGRTVQEEDELDKILAELGGPSTSISAPVTAASSQEVKVVIQPEPAVVVDEAEDEGVVESAAAKKKRKKKEKAKEKKEKPEEKKVCKGVRRMQEEIARRNEAEQRKKRKEDEEEEERRKQVERDEQEEEARRMKKDREKEKRLKKKQEGKLLTPKQKEEQRRQEAKRNQFLSSKGVSLPADSGAPAKRPIYSTKKKSKGQHAKTEMVEEEESVAIDEVIMVGEEEKGKAPVEIEEKVEEEEAKEEEEEEEEDDEWDAKSWDAADLDLNVKGAFEDGEVGSEPESSVKKEVKMSAQPAAVASSSHTLKLEKEISSVALHSEQSEGSSLRSPICCIMGHVDAGKTKLLDCIRGTNVQEGEAGGITQQIGATYFPAENIRERTKELRADAKLMVPGLLIIDTPGHECFINLRSHGSGLCDIAVVVVDIMHGLKKQTIESLDLLKMQNAYFIIALNKVDRLAGWKTCRNAPIGKALKQQSKDVQMEFNNRLDGIITQFKEQGLNTAPYYKNKERGETFNIVPTSAISGEGIPDMLLLLVQWTQKTMVEKLTYTDEVQCTVLEVKVTEGHGTTIDVILVNGVLREGDQIVVCGMQGPIVTTIRALMTPRPMEELRIKGSYLHHKEIKAAQGIKIAGQGLDLAIAGTSLHVVGPDDDIDAIKKSAMEEVKSVMTRIDKSGEGVCVQASSEGSLNALLEFLKTPEVNIPVSSTGIGPVHKKDVMRARLMLEKNKEFAAILAFDVDVAPDVREHADEAGVKIFTANVIYHLFDQFKAYIRNLKEEQKKEAAEEAVFPCVLRILPGHVYRKTDPILMGVEVLEGIAKVGTPICVPSRDFICIGKIVSIENNSKPVDTAKKGQEVAIKILGSNPQERQKKYGRHFELEDELVSQISRRSIDILKANYREDLSKEDWRLVLKLKILFKIQ